MRLTDYPLTVLTADEMQRIYHSALQILATMGMSIQHGELLAVLAEAGCVVDRQAERVRFPLSFSERYLETVSRVDWATCEPRVGGAAGIYHSLYHDPTSNTLCPWTEEALRDYITLARRLPHVERAHMLGCRLPVPPLLEPLYERYYAWKWGAQEFGSIHLDALCPYILELYQALAEERGQPIDQVFRGVVYLIPALKLGRHEAYQLMYFRRYGLRVALGSSMFAAGATSPITLAGSVTLNLAEQFALNILRWVLFGDTHLTLGSSITVLDMRTWFYPFGQPEMAIANAMTAQIARWLGATFSGHAALTDAPLPSPEAAMQKALTAVPTLLAGGKVYLDVGLLARDEVCSPIQMVLDDQLIAALNRYVHAFDVSEEAIGLDTILAVGPGGHYTDQEHTVRYVRQTYWEPALWWRRPLGDWLEGDRQLDIDRARDIALHLASEEARVCMSPSLDRHARQVIASAAQKLVT